MGMRTICIAVIALFFAGISWSQEKTTIAILDFEAQGVEQNEANVLTERVRLELFKTDRYTVMERSRMRDILEEWGFQQAICNESECIIRAGNILGVQQMVAGSVQKIGALYTISIRIVEVATGKVLAMASVDCNECSIEELALQGTRAVVQNLIQPESVPKSYGTSKIQSNLESKYYGLVRFGVRELYEDGTRGDLGTVLGLQLGREISRWFRVSASADRYSRTYSQTVTDQFGISSLASTKVTYFLYSLILDLQFPLHSSWFRPYLGMGISYAFLSSESEAFSISAYSIPLGKYDGVGFSSEIGSEFRLSRRWGLEQMCTFLLASRNHLLSRNSISVVQPRSWALHITFDLAKWAQRGEFHDDTCT
jgi:TolB-like protein